MKRNKEYRGVMLTCICFFIFFIVLIRFSYAGDREPFMIAQFDGVFGIQETKEKQDKVQDTPGNWTKKTQRVIQGGDPGGFWEPPPISDMRSEGVSKSRPSTGQEILQFWINVPANATIGQYFDYGPWADYGVIEQAMMWDVDGYVAGGYTRITRKNQRVQDKHKRVVEKWNTITGVWDKISEADASDGYLTFSEQGYYRISVGLYRTAFRSAPTYGTVMVKDPKLDRRGSEIFYEIIADLPSPFAGTGMAISGYGKPMGQYDGSIKPNCGWYEVLAKARQGIVETETNASRMMKPTGTGQPVRYRNASWILKEQGGGILDKIDRAEFYRFDANKWRDGNYILETYLAEDDQGKGIQNMPVPPAITSIDVRQCGGSPYWDTPEGRAKRKAKTDQTEADTIVKTEDLAAVTLNGLNNQGEQTQILFIHEQIISDAPPPPGKVPINLDECTNVTKQIVKRRTNLKVSCDSPIQLMKNLLGAPAEYSKKTKEFQTEWNKAIEKIALAYVPFFDLQKQQKTFLEKVKKANAAIPTNVLAQEKRKSGLGGAPIIGDGFPPAMFEFDPAKIEAIKQLNIEQRNIGSEWAKARADFERKLTDINNDIKTANTKFDTIYQGLSDIRKKLWNNKTKLSGMFMSGDFEHCLGQFSTGNYTSMPVKEAIAFGIIKDALPGVETVAVKQGDVSPLGLPGMNIDVAIPEKKVMPEIKQIPPPFKQVRLKQDGIWQQRQDRQVMEAMVEEARLKAYAKNGTFWIWLADTVYNKIGMGAIDAGVYDGLADSDMPFYEKMGKLILAGGKHAEYAGETIATLGGKAMNGIYYDIFEKPAMETASTTKFLQSIPEGIGEDIKNTLRGLGKSLGWLENDFDAKPAGKLGDSLAENALAVQYGRDQLRAIGEKSEEIDGATNNLIALLSASAEKAMAAAKAKGLTEKASRLRAFQDKLKEGNVDMKKMMEEYDDIADARKIAKMNEGGKPPTDADWKKKLDDFNKADELAQRELDDAIKKQAEKKALELEAAKAKMNQPPQPPVEPKKLGAEDVGKFNEVLSKEGRMGDVFKEPGNQKEVFKVMKADMLEPKTLEDALEKMNHNLQREKKGADLLGELGLEHAEITGVGNVKGKIKLTDGTFVESDKIPCMTKDYIGEGKKIEGQFLNKLMESKDPTVMSAAGKLSDEVQSAIVEYLNTANKKGVLLGDFKPDNIYLKKEGGQWKVGVADTDGIAKIADPAKARELQIAQLTSELGPIKHPGFVRGEIAKYTEAASVGGFEDLIDEKYINMLRNGDVIDNIAQNKIIREIQQNPASVLQGDELKKVQAAQNSTNEALKQADKGMGDLKIKANELNELFKPSKSGGDLEIPGNLFSPPDAGGIDLGLDLFSSVWSPGVFEDLRIAA